ncbi:MAG: DUF3658 domain-containing protein [Clostridiales Family XIII bacterium]|nr:DUF3658 domain-containing protein [Clostridiales Family XIII bacterium]
MLEVVFSDSVKGSMKVAKNYNNDYMCGSAISFVGGKLSKRQLKKMFEGEAVGGDPGDVVRIGLNLDIGDIAGAFDGERRKDEFVRIFGYDYCEDDEVERVFESQRNDFEKIPILEKCLLGDLWNKLKTENAPLRAVVNGKLISVPEDFYDHIIMRNIPDGEFGMARLIGIVMGEYALGVAGDWYASRIMKMIADNRLEIVEDKGAEHPYGKILRKV